MAQNSITAEQTSARVAEQVAQPLFAWWLWSRKIKLRPAGRALGISHEQVRRLCLPFGHANRAEPDDDLARRIADFTGHIVAPWTFEDTPGSRAIGLSGISGVAAPLPQPGVAP